MVAKTYLDVELKPTSYIKSLPKLRLKRQVQGWLITAKSRRDHFTSYHKGFGYKKIASNCLYREK